MPSTPIAYAGFALMLGVVAFALWRGDRLVRGAALLVAAAWVLVGLLQDADRNQVPWRSFAVDLLAELAYLALAVRTGRAWMAVLAALQLLNLSSYLAFAFDRGLFQRAFVTLSYLWSLGVLGSLAAGAAVERRARSGAEARRVRP